VDQAQSEIQLKVWKELAISKQLLMRTAAEALRLNPDCSTEDLKQALDAALKKSANADASVVAAQDQARLAIQASEKKITESQKAQAAAEATSADFAIKQEKLSQQIAQERTTAAKEMQSLKDRLVELEKTIKATNTALADTPENVIKKMKVLKKEKQDEAEAKRRVETALAEVRKEKKDQDQQLKDLRDNLAKLIAQHRELHALTGKLHEQLKPLAGDAEVPALPELDEKLILAIEDPEAAKKAQEEEDKKNKGKDKGNGGGGGNGKNR
jgi:colicin import membrane protein